MAFKVRRQNGRRERGKCGFYRGKGKRRRAICWYNVRLLLLLRFICVSSSTAQPAPYRPVINSPFSSYNNIRTEQLRGQLLVNLQGKSKGPLADTPTATFWATCGDASKATFTATRRATSEATLRTPLGSPPGQLPGKLLGLLLRRHLEQSFPGTDLPNEFTAAFRAILEGTFKATSRATLGAPID